MGHRSWRRDLELGFLLRTDDPEMVRMLWEVMNR